MKKSKFILLFLFILIPLFLFGNSNGNAESSNISEKMLLLIFQLSVIIFSTYLLGKIFNRYLKLPTVIGEILAGVIIGPYLLGSVKLKFLGFEHGLFPLLEGGFPLSPEIYTFSILGSIILLFSSGLETNFKILLYYLKSGLIIGLGGVLFSFIFAIIIAVYVFHLKVISPASLILASCATATSVGITARILSENNKIDSPEGTSILVAAVFDDVLGVITLAISLSIILSSGGITNIPWKKIEILTIKTLFIWFSATLLGIFSSNFLSKFLKKFKEKVTFSILAFGIALIIASILEKAGLTMIIGAYIVGLSLSKTEINYVITNSINPLKKFFVPVFFALSGMLIDLKLFLNSKIIIFGLIYSLTGILSKILGCGGPALFTGFNLIGALRIGIGMMPRGEVLIVIANIGYSYGLIDSKMYGIILMLGLISTIITPPILDRLFKSPKEGVKNKIKGSEEKIFFELHSKEIAKLFLDKIIDILISEGFYVTKIAEEGDLFYIRKADTFIELNHKDSNLEFVCSSKDYSYIKTLVYEAYLEINRITNEIRNNIKPTKLKKGIVSQAKIESINLKNYLDKKCIIPKLKSNTKEEIIKELVDVLEKHNKIIDKERVLNDIYERERIASTGLENGIAIPHAKSRGTRELAIAIGIKREGVNFDAVDGKPSKIFIMIIFPFNYSGQYLQLLSNIAKLLSSEQSREFLINCESSEEIYKFFTKNK
jgi:fructose-specific phosphotransferase system IIA component